MGDGLGRSARILPRWQVAGLVGRSPQPVTLHSLELWSLDSGASTYQTVYRQTARQPDGARRATTIALVIDSHTSASAERKR